MEKHDSIAYLLARRLKSGFSLPPCTRAEDYHTPAVILALGLLATLAAVRATAHVLYPFPLDTGEGTIVDAAWRVSRGVSIYGIIGDKPPYFFVIYNPLLPYLAGLVVKMSSALWSARLL